MIIGLTGQIGAGKTTAARILAELGAIIIDADQIGREVVDNSSALRTKLAKAFGSEILDARGRVRRAKLAELAFRNQDSRDLLNQLVHPHLLRELRRQVRDAERKSVVVIDAALLLDWDLDREADFVLVIHAGLRTRLERLQARGITRADGLARQRAQLDYSELQSRADRVILNHRTPDDLRRKVTALWRRLHLPVG